MNSEKNGDNQPKLYMLLLGSKAPGRHVEQHDVYFGIARSLRELVPDIRQFWPEAGEKIHIDAWREVNYADGHRVSVQPRAGNTSALKLFFINLGGYQPDKFEEQHYTMLSVKPDRAAAFSDAKQTAFFKHNTFAGANSHIDDRYGVDVDDLYEIDEILPPAQKEQYEIVLSADDSGRSDKINLGYLKLSLV